MSHSAAPRVGQAAREGVDYMPNPTEQRSGKRWVDGRPIWQATLAWTPGLLSGGALEHFIPNIAALVNIEGCMRTATGTYAPISNYTVSVGTASNGTVSVSGASSFDGWITLYYVRTTDPIPLRTD